jgi:prepilin-type N-terminal cleavage/methylation domain-containing protein
LSPRLSGSTGFTLSELLIALMILGEISAFTIPKVLVSQANGRYNASAKETTSMISGAFIAYKRSNTPTASTSAGDLTPFMNYLATDSSTTIDLAQTDTTRACNGTTYGCVKLHAGGILMWADGAFSGTSALNAIYFYYDPDGRVTDGTTNGPGKSVGLWLYYNGRVTSYANIAPNTVYYAGTISPNANMDPPWFSW